VAAIESRQSPIEIKRQAILPCPRPGGLGRPRKTLVPRRVQTVEAQIRGCRWVRRQPQSGSRLGRFALAKRVARSGVQSVSWLDRQTLLLARRAAPWSGYPKQRFNSKGLAERAPATPIERDCARGSDQASPQRRTGSERRQRAD